MRISDWSSDVCSSDLAHSAQRDWEADSDLSAAAKSEGCIDIARQLVEGQVGSRLDLILGGGRANILPATAPDPEYPAVTGKRAGGRDLIAEWKKSDRKRTRLNSTH